LEFSTAYLLSRKSDPVAGDVIISKIAPVMAEKLDQELSLEIPKVEQTHALPN
jgi:hypothetical protein